MQNSPENLPENPEDLKEIVSLLKGELKNRDILIEKLRHELMGHKRHRFGSSGESLDQLQLSFEEEEAIAKAAEEPVETEMPEPRDKRSHNRKPLPDHLERHEQTLSVEGNCSACGGELRVLGEDTYPSGKPVLVYCEGFCFA